MENLQPFGKFIFLSGIIIAGIGLIVMFIDKIPFFGKLPGDFTIKRDNFTFYFPMATSILISIIASLIFYFLSRRK
ncbi:MAG: DUF2905 domain-containing protein [Ignavibacteria bacterium]|jgi:hypothetical protein|nr:DUF2905 domain-containing protein [Ignavibacteria bacterium]MBK6876631.1 DUF2905 domain-containing protein [Ignavibacteria bacterium]